MKMTDTNERMSEDQIQQHCHELSRWHDETGKISLSIIMQYRNDLAAANERAKDITDYADRTKTRFDRAIRIAHKAQAELSAIREGLVLAESQYMGCGGNLTDKEALANTRKFLNDTLARLTTQEDETE